MAPGGVPEMARKAMAPAVVDEELELKKRARRRLVGAVVLVLLVVTILPWVLDDEPRPLDPNIDVRIPERGPVSEKFPGPPSPPGGEAVSGAVPPPPALPPSVEPEAPAESPQPSPTVQSPGRTEPRGDALSSAGSEASPVRDITPPQQARASAGGARFVIRIGAFANPDNARQVTAKLRAAQIPVYTESVKTAGGTTLRVRAGPYPSAEAAEQARQKVVAMKLGAGDYKVVRYGE